MRNLMDHLENLRLRIQGSAQRANRDVAEITLVAISKTQPADLVRKVLDLGVKDIGENRVQEAEAKITEVGRREARWHMVGHLQTNKVRRAVELFDLIHSVDSDTLAHRLNRVCEEEGRVLAVLIQVDLAGEGTKSGIPEERLPKLVATLKQCPHLRLRGLMALPPLFEDAELVRPFFRRLRELRDTLQSNGEFGDTLGELSMGMSHDFEVAIEEGATLLRIGTAIFGERL